MIDPNYLQNEADLDAMVTGFKKARDLLRQPAFAKYVLKESEPGTSCQTEEEIRQYIRQNAQTIYTRLGPVKWVQTLWLWLIRKS